MRDDGLFEIPQMAFPLFEAKFGQITKRASKLGLPLPTYTVVGDKMVRPDPDSLRVYKVFLVKIEGDAPKFSGWTLGASVDCLPSDSGESVNFLRPVPGTAIPEKYRSAWTGSCDHCGVERYRKSVFLLHHEDGAWIQVGSTCLKDFLGGATPEGVAAYCSYWLSLSHVASDFEGFSEGARSQSYLNLHDILSNTAAVLDIYPWVSKAAARDDETKSPTASVVESRMFRLGRDYDLWKSIQAEIPLTPRHEEEAEAATEWGKSLTASSDYEYNVVALCNAGIVPDKGFGLAVSILASYRRHLDKLQTEERRRRESAGHFGEAKKRYRKVSLRPISSKPFESLYGSGLRVKFVDREGHNFTWMTSSELPAPLTNPADYNSLYTDRWFDCDFTVKAHEEFKGEQVTRVTRVTVHGESLDKAS